MRWMAVLGALVFSTRLSAQIVNPTIDVTPERDSVTVGDSIRLGIRARLDDRDLLLDSVPYIAGEAPRSMRVLRAERVARQPDRTFAGTMVVAFYRLGRQTIPPLALSYRRNLTLLGAAVRSQPVAIEIVPVLPAGSGQQLRDIRGLATMPRRDWWLLGAGAVGLLLIGLWLLKRRRPPVTVPIPAPTSVAPSASRGALAAALERLDRVAKEQWPARGEVAHHYEAVIAVVRGYVAESAHVPARATTSTELLATLPVSMTPDGTRDRLRTLLRDADLVKFARLRPPPAEANGFLDQARGFLIDWTDAIR